jgi:hypothetical protein
VIVFIAHIIFFRQYDFFWNVMVLFIEFI